MAEQSLIIAPPNVNMNQKTDSTSLIQIELLRILNSNMRIQTLIFFLLLSSICFADSPLTSTEFSKAYLNEPILVKASKSKGILSNELMFYLTDESNPVDVKMALINKLGWNAKGKNNTSIFLKYLIQKQKYKNEEDFFDNGKGDDLLCFSYIKAMDDYNDVIDAIRYSGYALSKNPKSYTYQMISALIYAQKVFFSDRCQVYKLTDEVRKNNSLNRDMKVEAISIIFEYMDLYKHNCPS